MLANWYPRAERKEVRAMTYTKPEIATLGDAALLIQGSKPGSNDSGAPSTKAPGTDSEFEE